MINSAGVIAYMSRHDPKVYVVRTGIGHHFYAGVCPVTQNVKVDPSR